jgi:predicted DNA-binding protein with PD1-like motif
MDTRVLRFKPGQDLLTEIDHYLNKENVKAGVVLSCVGSLTRANLRLANQENGSAFEGYFEIVSLVGTLSTAGSHLHISISDGLGKTVGGHLLQGCKIYTTAELVLGIFPELRFEREDCELSGYPELKVYPINRTV